jgi:hypothetical protein
VARPVVAALALVASLALAACAGTGATTTPPIASVPRVLTATPTPAVVYQADWSHGLAGWQATAGWSVSGGVAQSDTADNLAFTIPFTPTAANYIVEVRIQIVSIPATGGQIFLHGLPAPGADGYLLGIFGLRAPGPHPFADHPTITAYIDPQDNQDPIAIANSVHDYEPGSLARTYQFIVSGSAALIAVDGHNFSWADSTVTNRLTTAPLVIMCSGVSLRISNLRILE